MNSEKEIEKLKRLLQSLLLEEPVMWDEVNAVERDLRFLLGNRDLGGKVDQGAYSGYDSRLMQH